MKVTVRLRGGRMDGVKTKFPKDMLELYVGPHLSFEDDDGMLVAFYWLVQPKEGCWIGVYDPQETAKRKRK